MERISFTETDSFTSGNGMAPGPARSGNGAVLPGIEAESHERLPGRIDSGVIVICDHASNAVPPEYASLGLPPSELMRHIAWDIGAAGVARLLAEALSAPAVLSRFSRLLIDPNRGEDDPTLIMRISDGSVIPGNAHLDAAERQRRLERFYRPYDKAIAQTIDAFLAAGTRPALVSVHSFTPVWRGVPRPWHAAVLYDPRDPDFSRAVRDALIRQNPDLLIGDNEPYRGGLAGDTMDRHGFSRRLPHVLIELRQDLVTGEEGQRLWARRLARAVREALDGLHLPDANTG